MIIVTYLDLVLTRYYAVLCTSIQGQSPMHCHLHVSSGKSHCTSFPFSVGLFVWVFSVMRIVRSTYIIEQRSSMSNVQCPYGVRLTFQSTGFNNNISEVILTIQSTSDSTNFDHLCSAQCPSTWINPRLLAQPETSRNARVCKCPLPIGQSLTSTIGGSFLNDSGCKACQ